MHKLSVVIFFILIFSNSKSQNILVNGDFEFYSSLPNTVGHLNLSTGWSNLNGDSLWPRGTPDYLHTSGSGGVQLPNSIFATVHPYSGNAIAGFLTYDHARGNSREYLSSTFSSPMLIGASYTISFWLSNGEANQQCGYSSNHIGVRFSTVPLMQNNHEPLGLTPQLEIPGEVWSTSWQNYSFTFIADSAYNYITIGNFFDDMSTTAVLHISTDEPTSYYFIDKIEVTPTTTTPLRLMRFTADKINKTILLNWCTTDEVNAEKFIIEHSTDGTVFNAIGIIKATGNTDLQTNYSFMHTNPSTTNYYRLKMFDIDGRFIYSEIKKLLLSINCIEMAARQNPFSNDISIEISSDVKIDAELFIVDIAGRLMYKQTTRLIPGINSVSIQARQWVKGLYIVGMAAGDEKRIMNMIKN